MARGECHFVHSGCAPVSCRWRWRYALENRRRATRRDFGISLLSVFLVLCAVTVGSADLDTVSEDSLKQDFSSEYEPGKTLKQAAVNEASNSAGDGPLTAVSRTGGPIRPAVLNNISIVETPDRALVIFSTNGKAVFDVSTSAKLTRKWIVVTFPGVKLEMPDRVAGGGRIIGEIYLDELVGVSGGVRVSIEVLPARIEYEFYRENRSLVLRTRVR